MAFGLPILTYHSFTPGRSPLTIDLVWFRQTLDILFEAGYQTVDLLDWIDRGRPPLQRAFALTFDDGLASIEPALAELVARRSTATVFLISGWMGRRSDWPGQPAWVRPEPVLTWVDAHAWSRLGIRFGAHTIDHPRLDRLAREQAFRQLTEARRTIEDQVGMDCRLFAYPYGCADQSSIEIASQHYNAAFLTGDKVARSEHGVWSLPRIDSHDLRTPQSIQSLIDDRLDLRLAPRRLARRLKRW